MKKLILAFASLFLACFCGSAEIVNWKGMELGLDEEPAWLEKYLANKNVAPIRRKFSINKTYDIIVGVGNAKGLETARQLASVSAEKKALGISKTKILKDFCSVYEFWQEDSEKGFSVYAIYQLRKEK